MNINLDTKMIKDLVSREYNVDPSKVDVRYWNFSTSRYEHGADISITVKKDD